ncbi:MAG: hypothetical protein HN366_16100 [Deltaproteobacteria bacterium]|nr:hypothetical protein [Deltaproteobacteria bacterium]
MLGRSAAIREAGWVLDENKPSVSLGPVSAIAGVPQEMRAMLSPIPSTFTHPVRFREFSVIHFIIELLSVPPAALIGRGASRVRSHAGAWERE